MKSVRSINVLVFMCLMIIAVMPPAVAGEQQILQPPQDVPPVMPVFDPEHATLSDVSLQGSIEGSNITFDLSFTVETEQRDVEVAFVNGDVVLQGVASPTEGYTLRYDTRKKIYFIKFDRAKRYQVEVSFAARPVPVDGGEWRQCQFMIPSANVRDLAVTADRTDLDIRFPEALRVNRDMVEGKLVLTALLGPSQAFTVKWKPQVAELDAKLVLTGEANTIATAGTGAMRIDSMFAFEIAQGRLTELAFSVPEVLSVTQVRGQHIRDWRLEEISDGEQVIGRRLAVILNRPVTDTYGLQIFAELALPPFPSEVELPVIVPEDVRVTGHLSIGTDSAIHLVVKRTGGLSQIDAAAFPLILLSREQPRPLPRSKAFFYNYAALPYQLTLQLDDIVPSFDATKRLVVQVKEDDLAVHADIELDVREAPVRSVIVEVPAGYAVAEVSGAEVARDAYSVREAEGGVQAVEVFFRNPVLGRTLIKMRLELGKSPLDSNQRLAGFSLRGAKNERGYLVVAVEPGVQMDVPVAEEDLRLVHTGAVPMQVAGAQYAYRFRTDAWAITLRASKMPTSIRSEAFHLVSLGEGVAYTNVAVTCFISGAPVDELHFRLPEQLQNVEFVGRDVSRWTNEGDLWAVRLQRKVIGDYNIGITCSQRWEDGGEVLIGKIESADVEAETGYIIVASHLNVKLSTAGEPSRNLLEIKPEEVPVHYRLMVNAPIMISYKFVAAPHGLSIAVDAYDRASLVPAIIEMMELKTTVDVLKDRETESVTRVRYKVKNSNLQFLALSIPKGATVWNVYAIEEPQISDQQGEANEAKSVRIMASVDSQTGLLMIPIPRHLNPNEPATIEVEYGQSHGKLPWEGELSVTAPAGSIRSTFASWDLTVPRNWTVMASNEGTSTMLVEQNAAAPDLYALLRSVALSIVDTVDSGEFAMLFLLCIFVGGALAIIFRRRWSIARVAVPTLLVLMLLAGIGATQSRYFTSGVNGISRPAQTLSSTQVLTPDNDTPLVLSARVIPDWRRHATSFGAIFAPVLALGCLISACRNRKKRTYSRVLASLGGVLAVVFAMQFSPLSIALMHLFTWGAPALLLGWFVIGAKRIKSARLSTYATAVVLCLALLASGCTTKIDPPPVQQNFVMERVSCSLTADDDNMEVELKLVFNADKPVRVPLPFKDSILLSPEKLIEGVMVRREGDSFYLDVQRRGRHSVTLKMLRTLRREESTQWTVFTMPMPPALMNDITLVIPAPGMQVEAPTAIKLTRTETEDTTVVNAVTGPGQNVALAWKPRARQVELEETAFFCEILGITRFDSGVVEARHRVLFRIAQGELRTIRLQIPANMTVTSIDGERIGAWRFNPADRILEARLSTPARDEYALTVMTQITVEGTPYSVTVESPSVVDAASQRSSLGVAASRAVHLAVKNHPQALNVDDFTRDAAALLQGWQVVSAADIRNAYRMIPSVTPLTLDISEMQPEIRTEERAVFTIADDRLVYNGQFGVEISKAGLFSIALIVPQGYDIDTLTAAEVSHWDETDDENGRLIHVHFRNRLLGQTTLNLALSRPETELPERVNVPRVAIAGALRHSGQVFINSDRGVRLQVATRSGVSELNMAELGAAARGTMGFRILKPDWTLVIATEVIKPRLNVDFLHVAQITEGLVQHTHYLSYRLHNAGEKVFDIALPLTIIGRPQIVGPDIVRQEQVAEGHWRIELANRWFDRPYPLRISYETLFDRTAGEVAIKPAKALDVDLQHGHIVINTTDRVELSPIVQGPSLERQDARSLPQTFGAGNLSGAIFCYRSTSADWELAFRAARHDAASLLEAEVTKVDMSTAVNDFGDSINQVQMQLRVSGKRHIEARLPAGAEIWSLLVNRRSTQPSMRRENNTRVILIPLSQAVGEDLPVEIELVYVMRATSDWQPQSQMYLGPQFDLPLRNVTWQLYLPETMNYHNFSGTLVIDERLAQAPSVHSYDLKSYTTNVKQMASEDLRKARQLQSKAAELAEQGEQYQARQAFESAYNYSLSDPALNEDARVQLRGLIQNQAVVGLVNRRGHVRQQAEPTTAQQQIDLGDRFNLSEAERLRSSLSKADSENLDFITERLIDMQESAAGSAAQLVISMPLKGRVLKFERPLQVNPQSEMKVAFMASRPVAPSNIRNTMSGIAILIAIFLLLAAAPPVLRLATTPKPAPAEQDVEHEDRLYYDTAATGGEPDPHDEPEA